LNCVEIGRRGWLFVARKKHKEKKEMEDGERRVDCQVIN